MKRVAEHQGQPGREALTARQRDVAALVARGYTNQQIAAELVISQGTAANHVQQILGRTGLASRAELAAWASQRGLAIGQNRLLSTLERLLEIDPIDLDTALDAAAQAVAEALGADKVDAFLFDPSEASLIARGTSRTPMGQKQHALGLHRLPVANGGRMVEVFELGTFRHAGHVDRDTHELRGIRVGLGVRSDISVPLEVAGVRAGVLAAVSAAPEFFSASDLRYLATVSRWVGMVAHRAELVQLMAFDAASRSRTAAAEELITILAHDFRNYLTLLRGRLELLGKRAQGEGHDRFVRDTRELVRSVDRLDRLVHDLLDTASLEHGVFDLAKRPVDLLELVKHTAADMAPAGRVQIRTQVDELLVSADQSRLRQVFENLLSNAWKVQPEGEPVLIEVAVCQPWATVTVADHGPGIAAEVLPTLFKRFARGSQSVGLGLGLYLARGITEAHGGSLEVQSKVGGGARFVVRLPLERPSPTDAEVAEPRRSAQGWCGTLAAFVPSTRPKDAKLLEVDMDRNTSVEPENDRSSTRDGEKHATTGGSAAAGAVTGGVVGAMAGGPIGAAVGAVGGAIMGAAGERAMHGRPGHEHVDGDEVHYSGDHEHLDTDCSHDHTFH